MAAHTDAIVSMYDLLPASLEAQTMGGCISATQEASQVHQQLGLFHIRSFRTEPSGKTVVSATRSLVYNSFKSP